MKQTPLSQLATVSAGQAAPKDDEFSDHGIPFVRAGSLDGLLSGKSESDLELVSDETAKLRKLKTYQKGTVLFAKSGMSATKDRIYVLQNPAYVVSHLATLIPNGNAHPDYLRLALKRFPPSVLIKDPAYPAISLGEIQSYEIPVPEQIEDQIRITHLLGKVEGLMAQRKQHLQQLNDLLKSVFLEMFGDPILNPHGFPVRRLLEFYVNPKEGTKCGPFGSALKKEELVDSGVPVWNMDNIAADGQMVRPFRMWITANKYDNLAAYSVQDGDIIISRAGTVGKMCVARMNGQPAIISTNLIRLRLGAELRPLHFVSLMLYCKGRVGRLKTGADGAFTHMNTGVLDSLEFPYPPVDLQDRFGEIASKVEGAKSRYQQSLADLGTLYGALSQQAFRGELDLSRMPMPDTKPEEEKAMPAEPLQARTEQDLVIHLPDTDHLPDALENAEARAALISQWLEAYRRQLGSTPFSVQHFMAAAQTRLAELHPDTDFELGANDYEHIKTWVFEALAAGMLTQAFDDAGNRIELRAVPA
ncbi:MAG: restriction endonuclease subunit S [Ferrovum myxofaciens]|nr:MAG: restriction endonuclease subunit S [Ferrovum myxofaciens]